MPACATGKKSGIDVLALNHKNDKDGFKVLERLGVEVTTASSTIAAFERRPARKPYREHLPRARDVVEVPACCTWLAGQGTSSRHWRSSPGTGR